MASALITVDELGRLLAGPTAGRPTVLDVRWRLAGPPGRDDYRAGHLPGAVYLDLDSQLCGPPGVGGRHPLPDPARLQAVFRAAGVRSDRPVVAYDNGVGAAARTWWTLRWAGHPDVRVLDGGFAAWEAAGGELTIHDPVVETGDFVVVPGGMPVLDADGAAALARDGVLLDARTPERYRGDTEPIDPVAGRVPGAVNAPIGGFFAEDGRLYPGPELRDRFDALGVTGSKPVGAYCGSGVTAAQTVLALAAAELPAALYVGSWSHWITDPERPVETG